MRCKSCNRKLLEGELLQTKMDGSPEDLCNICRPACYEEHNIFDHEYQHDHLQSGLLEPKYSSE